MRRGFKNSIQTRLFLLFLVSMTGILLIVSVLFYNRTTAEYQAKVSDLSQKNSSQTVALFDLLLKGFDSLSKSISNNTDIIRLLSQKSVNPSVDYINERSITNMIGAIYYSRDDLVGIHVLSLEGKVFNYGDKMTVVDPLFANMDWYKQIKTSAGRMVWVGVYTHSVIDTAQAKPVFAFGRLIYDLDQHKPIGIVLVETQPQAILSALDNLQLGKNSDAFILTETGGIVNSTSGLLPPGIDGQSLAIEKEGAHYFGKDLIVTSKIPFAGWTIMSRTPIKDLNVELERTKRYLIVMFAILIILSILIATFVSRSISSPLRRIVREMRQVETGNFNRVLNIVSYEEIGQLVESFNHMVEQIAELIERVKISSISEKNAELQALQSQVNPHFLYNTFDMIYWLLDENGNDKLGDVVLSLSHMFRYSSHWEDEVTLREEVEQISHYLNIIKMRLQGRLTIEIDIDEQWMAVRMPKMTLQPIIENAVKHGLEPLGRPGKLRLAASRTEENLTITVSDNGVGMTVERLAKLRKSLLLEPAIGLRKMSNEQDALVTSQPQRGGGIGLSNLQRRLRYMFGEEYGLSVDSTIKDGTFVRIKLPLPVEGVYSYEHSYNG
jgi:two-component system sensor histidine kinase YesM